MKGRVRLVARSGPSQAVVPDADLRRSGLIDRLAHLDEQERRDVLNRLSRIEGQVRGLARMVDEDKYCVDVLKQTYAVRRAIEKMEQLMLDNHLHTCVLEGIKDGRDEQVIGELLDLYELANK